MEPIDWSFEAGTIRIEGSERSVDALRTALESGAQSGLDDDAGPSPDGDVIEFDARSDCWRSPAFRYAALRVAAAATDLTVDDGVLDLDPVDPDDLRSAYELRPYQRDALSDWEESDVRADAGIEGCPGVDPGLEDRTDDDSALAAPAGVLELPTGSGKTVIALKAIERLATPTLVVVPTIDLLEQWRRELETEFDVPVGQFGGGEQRRAVLTVSTYDSAYLKADSVGDRFGLVVFDEVHHLGGEGYREIARLLAAPARLGLTATFERPDDAHEVVADVLGPLVHRVDVDALAGEHLADYDVKRLAVSLTPAEREAYEEHQGTFTDYLARSSVELRSGADYQELVKRSGRDPKAREALLAKQRAREIVYGSEAKLDALEDILDRHRDDRILVFTAHNDLAYEVAERFLIPAITHRTAAAERREYLERFREGTYSRLVTSNVLDEGVDVPDANVAVVLSGSGSEREFVQRLGRILRPTTDGDRALLYEVVSEETAEERVADRRR